MTMLYKDELIVRPLISVVMATFNGFDFFERQLASIFDQTLVIDELVIVDDCSDANFFEMLILAQNNNNKIKVFSNKKNMGSNYSFERALKICSGELIFISDQDDVWSRTKVERFFFHWKNEKKNLICSDGAIIDSAGTTLSQSEMGYFKKKLIILPQKSLLFVNSYSGHNMMIHKDLLNIAVPFPENITYDHWLSIVASGEHSLYFFNEKLTYHRLHDSNQVNSLSGIKNKTNRSVRHLKFLSNLKNTILASKRLPATHDLNELYVNLSTVKSNKFIYLFMIFYCSRVDFFPEEKLFSQIKKSFRIALNLSEGID